MSEQVDHIVIAIDKTVEGKKGKRRIRHERDVTPAKREGRLASTELSRYSMCEAVVACAERVEFACSEERTWNYLEMKELM